MATIRGTNIRNVLRGGYQADTILGLGGNDDLFGNGGNDTLKGGLGSDKLFGGVGNDKLFGEAGNDTLDGSTGNDSLNGGAGVDTLRGGSGTDRLNGGTSADTMLGGAGNDIYIVDSAGDKVIELAGEGADTVFSSVSYTLGAGVDRLTLTGSAATNATGDTLANLIIGNGAANILNGMDGDDFILPGGGSDQVIGGVGSDTVSYAGADPAVGLTLDIPTGVAGGVAIGDTFDSIETFVGTDGHDNIRPIAGGFAFGGGGNDFLHSTSGGATLRGDGGEDVLFGQTSSAVDIFWLQNNRGADLVLSYHPSSDFFVIVGSEFGVGSTLEPEEVQFQLNSNTRTGTNSQFVYDQGDNEIWFDPDGTGAQPVVLIAVIQNGIGVQDVLFPEHFIVI